MSNPSGAKGYTLERLMEVDIREWGFPAAYRPRSGQPQDRGDIIGVPSVVIECKNRKTLALPKWWRETLAEKANAEADFGLLVHKRKGKAAADDQWVTVSWGEMKRLLEAAGYGPAGTL